MAVCLDDEQKKLMDGIGYSVKDKAERVAIECSGEVDGDHTEEDTLKLMEATSRCLKSEMGRYQSSSWSTFGDRKVLAIQVVNSTITLLATKRVEGNKWAFIEQRSASIPRDQEDRMYWTKVIELLMKWKELLTEQEEITRKLKLEHVGLIKASPEDTIKSRWYRKLNTRTKQMVVRRSYCNSTTPTA